jgi:hypothetical protein
MSEFDPDAVIRQRAQELGVDEDFALTAARGVAAGFSAIDSGLLGLPSFVMRQIDESAPAKLRALRSAFPKSAAAGAAIGTAAGLLGGPASAGGKALVAAAKAAGKALPTAAPIAVRTSEILVKGANALRRPVAAAVSGAGTALQVEALEEDPLTMEEWAETAAIYGALNLVLGGTARAVGAGGQMLSRAKILGSKSKMLSSALDSLGKGVSGTAELPSLGVNVLGVQSTTATQQEAYRENVAYARLLAGNPEILAAQLEERTRDLPAEEAIAVGQQAAKVLDFIARDAPQPNSDAPHVRQRWQPTPHQVRQAADRAHMAQNPYLLVEKMKAGRVTASDVEVVRELYPHVHAELSANLLEFASERVLTQAQRRQISLITGADLDGTDSPEFGQRMQQVAAQPVQRSDFGINRRALQAAQARDGNVRPDRIRSESIEDVTKGTITERP